MSRRLKVKISRVRDGGITRHLRVLDVKATADCLFPLPFYIRHRRILSKINEALADVDFILHFPSARAIRREMTASQ